MIDDSQRAINISDKSNSPPLESLSLVERRLGPAHEQEDHEVLNVHGVLSRVQFTLVVVLICLSMATVWTRTDQVHQHQRFMRMYFNLNLLGMDNQGLYEDSDNIDESFNQFPSFQDQRDFIRELVNVTNSYGEDGIVVFTLKEGEPILEFEPVYLNGTHGDFQFHSVDQALQHFQDFQTDLFRDFMLSVSKVTVTSRLGDSKFAHNYQVIADISVHGGFMMEVDMDYQYQSLESTRAAAVDGLRRCQQVVASVLFFLFLYCLMEARMKGQNNPLMEDQEKAIGRRYLKWYLFLCLADLLVLLSWVLTPMAAWLQLLPLFEFPNKHEEDRDAFNFNKNIRYSLPLILKIWLPILIFLNSYVFFAMLMFSESDEGYFSNYFYAFFDYFYQMYQCGIYEIFVEMQQYGYIADLFYFFLFFYVFMVANTLVTAFFVTLIQLKLNEKEIAAYTTNLMKSAACPNCHEENHYHLDQKMIDILVSSPKLLPLVKDKSILHSPNQVSRSFKPKKKVLKDGSEIKVQIEHDPDSLGRKHRFRINEQFVGYSKKVQRLLRQLEMRCTGQKDKVQLGQALQALYSYQLPISWKSP